MTAKQYKVSVGGKAWKIRRGSPRAAINLAMKMYYQWDETASPEALKHRRKDPIGNTLTIRLERIE